MRVEHNSDGKAVVTMTFDELSSIQYALVEGVDHLEERARFQKRLAPHGNWKTLAGVARQARKSQQGLEKAVAKWARRKGA